MFNVLHIVNAYGGSDVYTQLLSSLDSTGDCRQQVFVPLNSRNRSRAGTKGIDFKVAGSGLHYSTRLAWRHRFLYRSKIRTMLAALEETVDVAKMDVVHAHMLCTDGAVALEVFKRYGIPYIAAVQNTDLNTYYRKFWWERKYFAEILSNASRVIFVSPKYQRKLLSYCPLPCSRRGIEEKSSVIPFGVSDFFLACRHPHAGVPHEPIRIVFAGAFYPQKGLKQVVEAIDILRRGGRNIEVMAIGRGLPLRPHDRRFSMEIESMARTRPWLKILDFMPHERLLEKLRAGDVFAMPSAPESFGLVYVEALSQGLPLIYTKNEGFDGYYPDGTAGWAVEPGNPTDIARKLQVILDNYGSYARRVADLDLASRFGWSAVVQEYVELYRSAMSGRKSPVPDEY